MRFDQEPQQVETLYKGFPKAPDTPKEVSRFRAFLFSIRKCLNDLAEAASGYAQTGARQKAKNLEKTEWEIKVLKEQARKFALEAQALADKQEAEAPRMNVTIKAEEVPPAQLEAEIKDEMANLYEKMEALRLLRGTKITLEDSKLAKKESQA